MVGRELPQLHGAMNIFLNSRAVMECNSQMVLSNCMPLICGQLEVLDCLRVVLCNSRTVAITAAQNALRKCMSLFGRRTGEFEATTHINRDAIAVPITKSEETL